MKTNGALVSPTLSEGWHTGYFTHSQHHTPPIIPCVHSTQDNLIASNWRLDSNLTIAGIDNEGFQAGLLSRKYLMYTLNGGSETLAQSATLDHLLQCILFPRCVWNLCDYSE